MRRFATGLDMAVSSSAVPSGLTIVVWCTGALLLDSHSTPTAGEVWLFAGGGLLAYLLLRVWSALAHTGTTPPIGRSPHWIRAGVIHTTAVATALGGALAATRLEGRAAWALAPFAAVAIYLTVSSVEMALLHAEQVGEDA